MPGHFTDFINLFHSTTILFKGKNFNRFSPPAGSNKQFHHSFFNCIGICIECKDTIGLFINHFIFFFKFCDTSACNIQHNHSIGFDSSGTNGLLQGSHCNSCGRFDIDPFSAFEQDHTFHRLFIRYGKHISAGFGKNNPPFNE